MSEGHIFLSYRRIEADFALKLAADLKNAGVNLWMDRLDAGIKVGDDWVQALQDALDVCIAVVAILSPDYVESKYCRRELKRVDGYGRAIYPVLLRRLDDKKWPFEIQEKQYIDFRDWRDEKVYQKQLKELLSVLKDKFPAQFGIVPDTETQYLTTLIAELESRKGVLEYVELSAQSDAPKTADATRPEPRREDEWAAGFSLLIDKKSNTVGTGLFPSVTDTPTEKLTFNSITEAVAKFPRFVLIGEPGAGKTTTIRRLALDAARQRLDNPRIAPLPLLLYLPRWGDEPMPLDFVRKHWPFDNDPAGLLSRGDVLLYLDGLNEMGATGVEKAKKLVAWFESQDAPQHVIVTCRAGDYVGELKLADTPTVLAEEMHEDKIAKFAKNYLGGRAEKFLSFFSDTNEPIVGLHGPGHWGIATGSSTNTGYPPDYDHVLPIYSQDRNKSSLSSLASNPYLLTALIWIYSEDENGQLPQNTGQLFRRLISALWEREHSAQTPGWISPEQMEANLSNLAFAMVDEGQPTTISLAYALKHLDNQDIEGESSLNKTLNKLFRKKPSNKKNESLSEFLRIAQSANLIEVNAGQVRFYHQYMLEYFAASKLALVGLRGKLDYPDIYHKRRSGKWDIPSITLCGMLPDANPILTQIILRDPFLAAMCVKSGVSISETTRKDLTSSLLDILHIRSKRFKGEINISWRQAAAEALGMIADSDTVEGLVSALSSVEAVNLNAPTQYIHVCRAAAWALAQIGKPALPGLLKALEHNAWYVRWPAAELLGYIGDPKAVPALIALLDDNDKEVCDAAEWALEEVGDPAVDDLLKTVHENNFPRKYKSINILGKIGDPRVVPHLIELLGTSKAYDEYAANALGEIGTREATFELLNTMRWCRLQAKFGDDNDYFAKLYWATRRGLMKVWNPDALPELIQAFGEEDSDICSAAREAVRNIGSPSYILLKNALHHPDWRIRGNATIVLGEMKIVDSVTALCQNLPDEHEWVRLVSAVALGKIGSVEAVPFLIGAINNGDLEFRSCIICSLGEIADSRAVNILAPMLIDQSEEYWSSKRICDHAAEALTRIGTPEALAAVEQWRAQQAGKGGE